MNDKAKDYNGGGLDKLTNYVKEHPIFSAVSLIVAYFLYDNEFMASTVVEQGADYVVMFSMITSYFAYYITYLRDKLEGDLDTKNRRIEIGYFIALIIITQSIFFSYNSLLTQYLPNITQVYYRSEVIVLLVLAPILKELAFRYLLYDKWASIEYGKIIGGFLIGLIYIVAHPISDIVGFTVYWLPTVFLFMVYDLGGVKASIVAHILFNIVAIL